MGWLKRIKFFCKYHILVNTKIKVTPGPGFSVLVQARLQTSTLPAPSTLVRPQNTGESWRSPSNEDSLCGSAISWDINHQCGADSVASHFLLATSLFFRPFYVFISTFLPLLCLEAETGNIFMTTLKFILVIGMLQMGDSQPVTITTWKKSIYINIRLIING